MATPEEMLRDQLCAQLDAQQGDVTRLHRYYDGDHDLPEVPEKCNEDLRRLRNAAVFNLCGLVVDARMERLAVQGFSFAEEAANDVWVNVWQANRLDADSDLVHLEALISRRSMVLVWPSDGGARIYPESPAEVTVSYEPGNRRERMAALKRIGTGNSSDITLWTPEIVYRWIKTTRNGRAEFQQVLADANPLGVVPVVEFLANPDLNGCPHSVLDRGVIKIQDRINKTVYDRLVMSEFLAFPQRWATGLDVMEDDDGNPIEPFKVGPNRIAVNEDANVKFGQWDAADIRPVLDAIESEVRHMAAVTSTPMYVLTGKLDDIKAEVASFAEAGLVKDVVRHQRSFGESWEEVIRIALMAENDPRASDQASEVIWADPEVRTRAAEADAALKTNDILPRHETWRRLGATPQQIAQWDAEMATDAFLAPEPVV